MPDQMADKISSIVVKIVSMSQHFRRDVQSRHHQALPATSISLLVPASGTVSQTGIKTYE